MPTSFFAQGSRVFGRGPAVPLPSHSGEPCGHHASWLSRPLRAVNNQHSHIDEELVGMQSQLLAQQLKTSYVETRKHSSQHHVFHDTELHPHQRQPQRHVHHDGLRGAQGAFDGDVTADHGELASAVELSYQYSSNIVQYRSEPTLLQKPIVHRARILDYSHPSKLSRDLLVSLLSGKKLLLELPDEPAAVSSLMTALGRAATKLRSVGLAMALDPVYDPAAVMFGGTCSSSGSASHAHANPGHSNSHHHHLSHHNGSGGGSPSSSQDYTGPASARRLHDSGSGTFLLCARAVPMPPAANAGATYTVGSSMGQEVLRVGPSVGVHALLPAMLRAVLRDGLTTLRCCWFDEELGTDTWSEDGAASAPGSTGVGVEGQACEDVEGGCDASSLWAERSGSPAGVPAPAPPADGQASLVKVPCVLRAIFKLDRQLRGLDLGGLVLLPHTFTRSCRDRNTQVLYLDVVIA